MSQPFTNPTGATWQTLLNEITLAYSERRQAIGLSAYTPTVNRDVQKAAYWSDLQVWLEIYCTLFIDFDNGPLTDAEDDYLFWTVDNWRAAAGIHQNGFRRKYGPKEALVTAFGQMQSGDAIGPWIFEDLQKGFGALRWTAYHPEKQWDYYCRDYIAPPDRWPDDLPHRDNPWIFSKLNNLARPVKVYRPADNGPLEFGSRGPDDYGKLNGVLIPGGHDITQEFFALTGENTIRIETWDIYGADIGFYGSDWLAKWDFTNA